MVLPKAAGDSATLIPADFKAATRETLDLERAQTLAMNTKRALGEQIRAKQERLDR